MRKRSYQLIPVMAVVAAVSGCSTRHVTVSVERSASTREYGSVTSAERIQQHVAVLAHNELGGRGTGSDGIDLAAGYIAGQFAAIGLEPGGPAGTYFQPFEIARGARLTDATSLAFEGCEVAPELDTDYRPFSFSAQGDLAGEVVFVGYGIVNPEEAYDDYAGVDVKGKVALMFRREPASWAGEGFTEHARFDRKVQTAAERGVVAVLIVNQDPGEYGVDGLMRFRGGEDYGLPAIHVKRELAEKVLAAGGLGRLDALQRSLDEDGANVSAALAGVSARGTVAYEIQDMVARNVIGVLPGMGPGRDEYVVIGAHYDHLGIRGGEIYNGADDNASGTAGVIEACGALAATRHRNRSVICMTFTGEEMGLHGSRHFVEHPTVPIDSIVAMLNMDMIGRLTPEDEANMLAIQGLGTGESFEKIVSQRASEAGLEYLPDASALGPSDHAPFYRAGVPALFFFTGVHEDYHQPTDDTEKLNAAGAARTVDLVYNIALDIVNDVEPPVYAEVTERARIFRGASPMTGGVVMGIMPDMEDDSDEPGWRVARVFPGGGAAKAGIRPGDRIVKIEDVAVNGFADYREATAGKSPGDVVSVTVVRGDRELAVDVELSARGQPGARRRAARSADSPSEARDRGEAMP